jgi:hypothetical protein
MLNPLLTNDILLVALTDLRYSARIWVRDKNCEQAVRIQDWKYSQYLTCCRDRPSDPTGFLGFLFIGVADGDRSWVCPDTESALIVVSVEAVVVGECVRKSSVTDAAFAVDGGVLAVSDRSFVFRTVAGEIRPDSAPLSPRTPKPSLTSTFCASSSALAVRLTARRSSKACFCLVRNAAISILHASIKSFRVNAGGPMVIFRLTPSLGWVVSFDTSTPDGFVSPTCTSRGSTRSPSVCGKAFGVCVLMWIWTSVSFVVGLYWTFSSP